MCGILWFYLYKDISGEQIKDASTFLKLRGPDATNAVRTKTMVFIHHLLSIINAPVKQPHTEDGVTLLFNGEIYNYNDSQLQSKSDTQCIIPAYMKHGAATYASHLDGEFAIILYDKLRKELIISTDPFMTKPIWFAHIAGQLVGVCSYESPLKSLFASDGAEISMARPNSTYVYRLTDQLKREHASVHFPVFAFDFSGSKKNKNTNDWITAFERAVKMRCEHGTGIGAKTASTRVLVPLSSGYDSGCITLAACRAGAKFDTYSISKGENEQVLRDRVIWNRTRGKCEFATVVAGVSSHMHAVLSQEVATQHEPFQYVHIDGDRRLDMHEDGGAKALHHILKDQKLHGYRIVLSGSGADELFSDYGHAGNKIYPHSEFGGLWTDENTSKPWRKFYDDTQRSYLFKDDYICGGHGMEGRYPFLDRQVVQEWLWLTLELKNSNYKAPLFDYLQKHEYPVDANAKRGFQI